MPVNQSRIEIPRLAIDMLRALGLAAAVGVGAALTAGLLVLLLAAGTS